MKPIQQRSTPVQELAIRRNDTGQIWSPVRQKRLFETPEERVRQEFLCVLADEYGYAPEQIGEEEELTGRGSGQARADHVVWRSAHDKSARKLPLLVIEYKSCNISILGSCNEAIGGGDSSDERALGARSCLTRPPNRQHHSCRLTRR